MPYEVRATRPGRRELQHLIATAQEGHKDKITEILDCLEDNPWPRSPGQESSHSVVIKKLQGSSNEYRARCGPYRIVYTIEEHEVVIRRATHRKDVYRKQ